MLNILHSVRKYETEIKRVMNYMKILNDLLIVMFLYNISITKQGIIRNFYSLSFF